MPTTEQRLAALEVFAQGGAYVPPTDEPTPTPTPQPPAVPTGLNLATTAPGDAALSWSLVDNAAGYEAVYADSAGMASPVRETTTPSISWQGLTAGTYTFAVRAKNATGASDWARVTGEVKAKPQPQGDAPPYPTLPPAVAKPGDDLAKLQAYSALPPGEYTTSGDISRGVVAQQPLTVTLKLKPNQTPQLPDVFAGITVTGGGLPDNDDVSKAGPKTGGLVHTCRFTGSEGFGLLLHGKCEVWNTEVDNNASGGLGGTGAGTDALVQGCHVHHNNLKYRRSNSNKVTRGKFRFRKNNFHDNAGVDIWADNYTQRLEIDDNDFAGCQVDHSKDRWTAANVRGEISDNLIVTNNRFNNDITAPISCDEMHGATITGNRFAGKAKMAIELRDNARGTPFHSLKDVKISGNTFATNDLNIVPSGNISLSKHRITVTADNKWPDNDVKGHVKIKP